MLGNRLMQKGKLWEEAECTGYDQQDNSYGTINYNKIQSDDPYEIIIIIGFEPLGAK
jgi:hypothetical protein